MNPALRTLARTALGTLLLAGTAAAQTTWYVDDDGPGDPFPGVAIPGNPAFSDPLEDGSAAHPFDELNEAIDAALNGDTVLVLPSNVLGYYALPLAIDLDGKALTVASTGGPDVTALDGAGLPGLVGVRFDSFETEATVFEGFTLQNFDSGSTMAAAGGAMLVNGASPTIRDCRFVSNHAYFGGGLYLGYSSSLVEDCTFELNTAVHQGGGVYTVGTGTPEFVGCTFELNQANYGAGALFRTFSPTRIQVRECLFLNNTALLDYGGGLGKFDEGKLEVTRSLFVGNSAATDSGAIRMHGGGFVHECVFIGNSAPTGTVHAGAGGSGATGTLDVFGCTFTQNVGGSVTEGSGTVVLRNSISWDNMPFEVGAGVDVTYSNVLGGAPGVGNLDVDPAFRNPLGKDGIPGTLDDDLRLKRNSPCIDAGDTVELHQGPAWANSILVPYPTDFRGAPRAIDAPNRPDVGVASLGQTVDMGAYEFQPPPSKSNQVVNPQPYP